MSTDLCGINVSGYLRTESGVGAATRSYVEALRALDIPLALQDLSDLHGNRSGDDTLKAFDSESPYDINLVCADIDKHFAILSRVGDEFFRSRYNIGVWWWELLRFPMKWYDRFAYYDEIWVGTSFIAGNLAPVSPLPVIRVPPVLTPRGSGSREKGRLKLGLTPGEFVFLFTFDFHSSVRRKNPSAVIDAFKKAFSPREGVRLVLKCINEGSDLLSLADLQSRSLGHPISIVTGYWTGQEMRDLVAACDSYVSLHRAEGAGLAIADAMVNGKPVIATSWSGNMDFMNAHNSFPVRYRMVEIEENVGPYQMGEIWADPCVEHAAELMRYVYEHRDEARGRGQAATAEIETNFSRQAVARIISTRLNAIGTRRQLTRFRDEVRQRFLRYKKLPGHLRQLASTELPPDAVVAVVSKGDDDLLNLDGRRAWHFPQGEDGAYPGYYPRDSAAAVSHLESLIARGATHLLFPNSAFWWLDFYTDFARYLDTRHERIWDDDRCIIYELVRPQLVPPGSAGSEATLAGSKNVVVVEAGAKDPRWQ